MTRVLVRPLIVLGVLVLFTFAVRNLLLSGANLVTLPAADKLEGSVSQSLAGTEISSGLPQPGEDYNLKDVHEFENGDWAVVTIEPLKVQTDNATLVLHKDHGFYQPTLGPSTSFSNTEVTNLPPDVTAFMIENGAVYGPNVQ